MTTAIMVGGMNTNSSITASGLMLGKEDIAVPILLFAKQIMLS
jgi:hypothetical protein